MTQLRLSEEEIEILDRQLGELFQCKSLAENEIKVICEKVFRITSHKKKKEKERKKTKIY
jgi:hypothetical protein